jgi:hypothetical protein
MKMAARSRNDIRKIEKNGANRPISEFHRMTVTASADNVHAQKDGGAARGRRKLFEQKQPYHEPSP